MFGPLSRYFTCKFTFRRFINKSRSCSGFTRQPTSSNFHCFTSTFSDKMGGAGACLLLTGPSLLAHVCCRLVVLVLCANGGWSTLHDGFLRQSSFLS